jgi:orotate phosphoribosyltransferase
MELNAFNISLAKNPNITINVIPGHFTTPNAHSNNYLDFHTVKGNTTVARDVAREMAIPYLSTTPIDTIVCMEKMDVIGAYLAQELTQDGTSVINSGNTIHVVSPINNMYGNLVFASSVASWLSGKNILLLIATISSGRTLYRVLECIAYYGGKLAGISSLYQASDVDPGVGVNSLFRSDDIPGYKLYNTGECELCKNGVKLDAVVSSEGYTRID